MSLVSQLHTSGPMHLFIATQAGSPVYLGTAVDSPIILIQRKFTGAPNDIAGGTNGPPMDLIYNGQMAFVSADLSRFSNAAYEAIKQFPHTGLGAAGTDLLGDVGALVHTESRGFRLWVKFPYAAKAAMSGDPAGYRFPLAAPVGEPEKLTGGTGLTRLSLNFLCTRTYNPLTGAQTLYDYNMTGLPVVG